MLRGELYELNPIHLPFCVAFPCDIITKLLDRMLPVRRKRWIAYCLSSISIPLSHD